MTYMATMYSVAIFLLCALTSVQGMVCKNDTDCGTGECCYIQPEFMVVSKRDVPLVLPAQIHSKRDTGVCERYRSLHENCGVFEKANGHCGCPDSMACQFVPAETVPPKDDLIASKRKRSVFIPGPGAFQCEHPANTP